MRTDEAQARESGAMTQEPGRNLGVGVHGAEAGTAATGQTKVEEPSLMDAVVERSNLWAAYRRVVSNRGAPGVDGLPVDQFADWLKMHWPSVKAALLEGRYMPEVIRAVDIPKPAGGVRTLGIPTVLDRLIQQALHQVLQPIFEPGFSESSYGFRPERSAQQAVLMAQQYVQGGRRWVVDIDLEKFFDRVNHDILMSRIARQVKDDRVLKLIRRYLEAGLMREGMAQQRREGTPQGGPLSPLLSNILLTDWDRELERRGHAFCRYADDCNIYVRSKAAGERLLIGMTAFLAKRLKLKVNEAKSACDRPWKRKFLGYSMTVHRQTRLRIAPDSLKRLMGRVKTLLREGRGRSLSHTIETLNPVLRGWINYFRFTQSKRVLEELDGWIRRRLRCLLWRQAKHRQGRTTMLRRQGLPEERAWRSAHNGQGPWWNAGASHMGTAFPKRFFDRQGLVSMLDTQQRLQRS
ncbi:group II intron reverse transcriptase/maturase [Paraburkholderia ginsengiterrae]|uniref:RNA-directed DNA polymerase n=2 Tax=Paraburkholderia TaxID=1822464 RepID=A0A1A9NG09_9BURK|nr:group II intron reverse transcriptase/maturase [Paraburkholderia ginsengiterrae]OAJ52876.1 group II intron reverse transcriptase/maturase [Paraburkholderia ginsengiterrae]OAJ65912.1 group II intron reverse transcriptase/maturase [Paraburkholderia ginsengiterrae]